MTTPGFTVTDEQQELRRVVRSLFTEHATSERVRTAMMNGGVDDRLWTALADMGLLGLTLPEETGGAGAGMQELAIVVEEAGRRLAPVPLLASAVMGTAALQTAGTDTQVRELGPEVARGATRLALVAPTAAGRPGIQPGVHATRTGDGWTLQGSSGLVVGGAEADLLITAATTATGTELFLVRAGQEGVTRSRVPPLDLTRPLTDMAYDDVWVDEQERLQGSPAPDAIEAAIRAGTAALACEQVGAADQVLAMTVQYAKDRIQFGRPIGSFQAIKHRLADHLVRLESARSVAWHAAHAIAHEDDEEERIAIPMAAALCSEVFEAIAADCLQIHGGIGFTWEHDVHLYLKRAKSSKLLLGDPRHHRRQLGDVLGL